MTISLYEFAKMINPTDEIPEYMKSFIEDIENNKRYCVCVHKRYAKNIHFILKSHLRHPALS